MSKSEALVSMAQTALRVRGEWYNGATAHRDIEAIVRKIAPMIDAKGLEDVAANELKRRAGLLP